MLYKATIASVLQLASKSEAELNEYYGLTDSMVTDVKQALAKYDLTLGADPYHAISIMMSSQELQKEADEWRKVMRHSDDSG